MVFQKQKLFCRIAKEIICKRGKRDAPDFSAFSAQFYKDWRPPKTLGNGHKVLEDVTKDFEFEFRQPNHQNLEKRYDGYVLHLSDILLVKILMASFSQNWAPNIENIIFD